MVAFCCSQAMMSPVTILVQCCTDVARGNGYLHILRNDNPARVTYLGLVLGALVGQREVAFLGILELHDTLDAVLYGLAVVTCCLSSTGVLAVEVEGVALDDPCRVSTAATTVQALDGLAALAAVDEDVVLHVVCQPLLAVLAVSG